MVGWTNSAAAGPCTCVPNPPPREAGIKSAAVFEGAVADIAPWDTADYGQQVVSQAVTFDVTKVWKGPRVPQLRVFTIGAESTCGYPFKWGRQYLVYAALDEQGRLSVGQCSRTSLLEHAADDLKDLAAP